MFIEKFRLSFIEKYDIQQPSWKDCFAQPVADRAFSRGNKSSRVEVLWITHSYTEANVAVGYGDQSCRNNIKCWQYHGYTFVSNYIFCHFYTHSLCQCIKLANDYDNVTDWLKWFRSRSNSCFLFPYISKRKTKNDALNFYVKWIPFGRYSFDQLPTS